jgi:serine/threonine-protein kinase
MKERPPPLPPPVPEEPPRQSLYGEELAPGAQVGSYIVERACYRGSVSTLYRGREARTGQPAALKVMQPQFATARSALLRFRQEAETLQRLRHPHIVDILEHGALPDGRPFIAMEWLEGRDLAAELAARGPYSAQEALEVVEQVGSALRAAHGADIIHRDLKAQNVVVLPWGAGPVVKLVDFGVAKLLVPEGRDSALTSTGMVLGTPVSMAPEQIRAEVPDARTDVYALGVLLYQLVTGQPPFLGSTQVELEEQHLHAPPPRPSERAPVPAAWDTVVRRCLEKRREERYPDVEAVLEALRQAVRQGSAGRSRQVRAVGLYVETPLPARVSEAVLDEAEALLGRAREAVRAAGLSVVVEGGNFLLAVATLAETPEAQQAARSQLLEVALALSELSEERHGPGQLTLAPTLHVDSAVLRTDAQGKPRLGGGRMLRLSTWTGNHPGRGVVLTEAAMEGLAPQVHAEPLRDRAGVWLVTRPH